MIRNLLLSSTAILAVASSALAADLPSRRAPPAVPYVAAPIFTWTGFYVGADVGGAWTNDSLRVTNTTTGALTGTGSINASGVVGGLFAGYNYQMPNNIVVGVEADVEATSLNGKFNNLGFAGYIKDSLPWQGSVRARLGYAFGNALLYATGGVALAQINTKYLDTANGSASFSHSQAGWTLGAGVEYAINKDWSLRGEYRFTRFTAFNDAFAAASPILNFANRTINHAIDEHAVRVGVAYHFGAPAAPVVAKY